MASSPHHGIPSPKEDVNDRSPDDSSSNTSVESDNTVPTQEEWKEYFRQLKAASTQTDSLPPVSEIELTELVDILKDENDSEQWLEAIERILNQENLCALIDNTISRPSATHPRASEWQRLSMRVCDWLLLNTSDELKSKITKGSTIGYADEYIAAVKRTLRNPRTDFRRFRALHDLRRESFATIPQYFEAYSARIHDISRAGLLVPWYEYANFMIIQLQGSEDAKDQLIFNHALNLLVEQDEEESVREGFGALDFFSLGLYIIEEARSSE